MPLNPRQRDALDALTWLFDDSARRSGRSLALAVAAIRAACLNPGIRVRVFDHAMPSLEGVRFMMQHITDIVRTDQRLEPFFALDEGTFTLNLPRPVDWLPGDDVLGHLLPLASRARAAGQRAGRRLRGLISDEEAAEMLGLPLPEPVAIPESEILSKWERIVADDD